MSEAKLQLLNQELNKSLLKPNEYLKVYGYLINIGANSLANDLIKTAFLSYPNIGRIKTLYQNAFPSENGVFSSSKKVKVFCIGLSRTGTNSLSDALKFFGLTGQHWTGKHNQILEWYDIENFDFLSDTPISFIFETLYYAYPDAYFIYTTRDKAAWVKSMDNHFKWANGFDGFKKIVDNVERGREGALIREPIWGVIHKNLYTNAKSWSDAYDRYDKRVKKFFSSQAKPLFLPLDISLADKQKWSLLSNFFNLDFVPLRSFPRKNIKIQSFSNEQLPIINSICDETITQNNLTFKEKSHTEYIVDVIAKKDELSLPLPKGNEKYYAFANSTGVRPKIDVIEVDNCFLSLDFSKAYSTKYYIFDENKNYLNQLSNGDAPFIAEEVIIQNKVVGFVEDKFSQFNICHLLLDKLPRAQLFTKSNPESILLFKQNSYIEQACELLGLNVYELKKQSSTKVVTIQFKKLLLTSASSYNFIHPGQNISPHVTETLKNLASDSVISKNNRKIFIDRKQAKTRNILNHQEVIDLLVSHDFEIIQPENLTLIEQIELFKSASIVIGVHGAGLTNIAFCQKGTKVVELMPALCGTNAFWKLATALELDYYNLLTDDIELPQPDYSNWKHQPSLYNRRDVYISTEKLKEILNSI